MTKKKFTPPALRKLMVETEPALRPISPLADNCIVCDRDVSEEDHIIVFEFAGFGVEVFTFPARRQSVWEDFAVRLVSMGGIPRNLCDHCHHGSYLPATPEKTN